MTNSELADQLLAKFAGDDHYGESRVFKSEVDAIIERIAEKDAEIERLKAVIAALEAKEVRE